jgi:hypothetical protein
MPGSSVALWRGRAPARLILAPTLTTATTLRVDVLTLRLLPPPCPPGDSARGGGTGGIGGHRDRRRRGSELRAAAWSSRAPVVHRGGAASGSPRRRNVSVSCAPQPSPPPKRDGERWPAGSTDADTSHAASGSPVEHLGPQVREAALCAPRHPRVTRRVEDVVRKNLSSPFSTHRVFGLG